MPGLAEPIRFRCDDLPALAPADAVVGLAARLAADIEHVIVATDADRGGVGIANQIATALTGHPDVLSCSTART